MIFRAISGPLAHRGEDASSAVVALIVVPLGLDVRVDGVRDGPVSAARLMLVDHGRAPAMLKPNRAKPGAECRLGSGSDFRDLVVIN